MDRGFRFFPEQGSTIAADVDALLFFLLGVSAVFIVLIAGSILLFAIRYRRRHHAAPPAAIAGSVKLEIAWTLIPLALTMIMFVWGAALFMDMQSPPADAMEIYVVAKQWMWKIEHPSGRREINHLHVPSGQPVRLTMISEDVIHSFYVPAFRVKQDVLPGRYTTLWFEATEPGQHHLFCAEYCGTNHSEMIGTVTVLRPADYGRWLSGEYDADPLATRGAGVFQRQGCLGCHGGMGDVAPASPQRGPPLVGRFGETVPLADGGTVEFDEQYVRQSILEPRKHISAGYQPIMPAYQIPEQITEEEIVAIIDHLKNSEP